jgi:hypothetical protein
MKAVNPPRISRTINIAQKNRKEYQSIDSRNGAGGPFLMARRCTVCSSEHRHSVDIALTFREPHQAIADRFGVSIQSVGRHSRNCLSPNIRAAILTAQPPSAVDLDALREREGSGLLSQLVTLRARLEQHSQLAASLGNRSITENLRLVAQLLGTLVQRHEVTNKTSVFINSDYLELREALLDVLKAHPEARETLMRALSKLETKEAARMIDAAKPKQPLTIEHHPTNAPTP